MAGEVDDLSLDGTRNGYPISYGPDREIIINEVFIYENNPQYE